MSYLVMSVLLPRKFQREERAVFVCSSNIFMKLMLKEHTSAKGLVLN